MFSVAKGRKHIAIKVYPELDSTNREAKAQAMAGEPHGTVILAERQTAGKGRNNKRFFSPPGSGLYMSIILDSDKLGFKNITAITAYAALCVCETIENVCNLKPEIKWVNDIFLNGKKICGILTEAITGFENTHQIILGIGINITTKTKDFPKSLQSIAGSIYPNGESSVTRDFLVAELMNRILYEEKPNEKQLFEKYKKRLFMLNTTVTVIEGNDEFAAKVLDINQCGHLLIKTEKDEIKKLVSGEIKV